MSNKAKYVFLILSIVLAFRSLPAQEITPEMAEYRKVLFTLTDGDYRLVRYFIPYDNTDIYEDYGDYYELFYRDKIILTSILYPKLSICNYDFFCGCDSAVQFLKDITGDGKPELTFYSASGGSNGAENVYIYSIDTAAVLIGKFDGFNKSSASFIDIDGDNIPEMICCDIRFQGWNCGCSNAPCPTLVWKWDGDKYRLANFKFKDYILLDLNTDSKHLDECLAWYIRDFPNSTKYAPYPTCLWRAMLDLIYAGESDAADSLFDKYWPSDLVDKDSFYKEFTDHLHSGSFWEELQNSDW